MSVNTNTPDPLVKRLQRNANGLGWRFPFFGLAVARIEFRAAERPSTACVDYRGLIRVNPSFAETLTDGMLQFVIAHEILHLLLMHHERRGLRDPLRWNLATDYIINRTLKNIADSMRPVNQAYADPSIFAIPVGKDGKFIGVLADESQAEMTAEQLYSEIENEISQAMRDAFADGDMPVAAGCGVEDPDGDGDSADDRTPEEHRRSWHECAIQSQFQGRNAGSTADNLLADLLTIPEPKVRWAQVLRRQLSRVLNEAGHDDVSWSRRSRRSTTEIILPGGVTHRCKAAVVIDTSGSMSDQDLATCVAETASIVNNCNVPVFLVAHDHAVQEACWIRPGGRANVQDSVKRRMKGRGGTSFTEAYQRVDDEPGQFNVMVHLTDGEIYNEWPDRPASCRRLVVALVGSANKSDVPQNAQVIEVEF